MKKDKTLLLPWGFILLMLSISAFAQIKERPNNLLVVSDDLNTRIGPSVDSSLEIHTPNLDRLASEGVTLRGPTASSLFVHPVAPLS